jgi:hypothetical protein
MLRAQKRIARQRLEADVSLGAILNLRKAVFRELKVLLSPWRQGTCALTGL